MIIDVERLRESNRQHQCATAEYTQIVSALLDGLPNMTVAFTGVSLHGTQPDARADASSAKPVLLTAQERLVTNGGLTRGDARITWQHVAFDLVYETGYMLTFGVALLDATQEPSQTTLLTLMRRYVTRRLRVESGREDVTDAWKLAYEHRDTDSPYRLALSDLERENGNRSIDPESVILGGQLALMREHATQMGGSVTEQTVPLVANLMVRVLRDKLAKR